MKLTAGTPDALPPDSLLIPDWELPPAVRAIQTTRRGGASQGPWAGLNLALHTGDHPPHVHRNRQRLTDQLQLDTIPRWPDQIHGTTVIEAQELNASERRAADAVITRTARTVCTVQTADCLPVLFAALDGSAVAAAHAGWRGLVDGVLEATVRALQVPPDQLTAWLGPAIGPDAFEVGPEVRDRFCAIHAEAAQAFRPGDRDRWYADLYQLARQRLHRLGIERIGGGSYCTHSTPEEFFSYRRDGITGRMATLIWIDS